MNRKTKNKTMGKTHSFTDSDVANIMFTGTG